MWIENWNGHAYYNYYIENVGGYEFPRDELLCTQTFLNRGCMFASKWWNPYICINIIFPSCKIMSFTVIFPLILKNRLSQKLQMSAAIFLYYSCLKRLSIFEWRWTHIRIYFLRRIDNITHEMTNRVKPSNFLYVNWYSNIAQ